MASLFMTSVAKDNLYSVQRSRFDVTTWFLRRMIRYREKVDISEHIQCLKISW
jgi:hypothetical protein